MCRVCQHSQRADIENMLLELTDKEKGITVESIAEEYGISTNELKLHALYHTPLVRPEDVEVIEATQPSEFDKFEPGVLVTDVPSTQPAQPTRDSLVRRAKLREMDMLEAVSREYLVTLKAMGRRINKLARISNIPEEDQDLQIQMAKMLTKPMTDLYIGLGGEIRQAVKTMSEVDRMLNGPEDSAVTGLRALTEAIRGSGA